MKTSLSNTAYPITMLVSIALHMLLVMLAVNIVIATYIPVILAVAAIAYLEWKIPFRIDWKPKATDIKIDFVFMMTVQMLLPQLLSFVAAIWLVNTIAPVSLLPYALWPNNWPAILQAVLMLLLADFFRYWLHRASHFHRALWRLHAVHHAPEKLYWLNVGRFHPLEKSLQFLFDALPFILLGVSEQGLALYFVFYAVNGFFQHANVDVKLGMLNYLISGPELHRWHHSKNTKEANNNYGNNLIIWDLIFSTRYLPVHKSVCVVGVKSPPYRSRIVQELDNLFSNKELNHE